MKAISTPSRTRLPGKEVQMNERRKRDRKDFTYYVQLFDHDTQKLVGHLADINSGGFKLDSQNPMPINKDFRFRLDLTSEVAYKPYMVFVARSRWCKVDPLDPFCYNIGFQLVNISPEDAAIFNRMADKFGAKHEGRFIDLRRSNLW
jgi:hypothetical protein